MKKMSVALILVALGIAACSKTETVENNTTNTIVTNDSLGVDTLNESGNSVEPAADNASNSL